LLFSDFHPFSQAGLALLFAQMYPERVSGMVIRGIFTGTSDEMDVIYTKKGLHWCIDSLYYHYCFFFYSMICLLFVGFPREYTVAD
jgi:hypothetical protein